jgi:hypothetical protein
VIGIKEPAYEEARGNLMPFVSARASLRGYKHFLLGEKNMKNKTLDLINMTRLNNYLVAALELLDNKDKTLMREVIKARMIYELALQLIDNYALMSKIPNTHDGIAGSLTGKLLASLKILIAKRELEITNRRQAR